jgi:hypothetical protein
MQSESFFVDAIITDTFDPKTGHRAPPCFQRVRGADSELSDSSLEEP